MKSSTFQMLCRFLPLAGLLLVAPLQADDKMVVEIKDAPGTKKKAGPDKTKVYRNYNANGVVEFTDRPQPGGEAVKIQKLPTYTPPPVPKFTPGSPATSGKPRAKVKPLPTGTRYDHIRISQPANDSSIRSNAGQLNVSVQVKPTLRKGQGHHIQYLLDGKPFMTGGSSVTLHNIDRGTHNLEAVVLDHAGRSLIRSGPIQFHMLRYFKPQSKMKEAKPKPVTDVFGDDDT